MWYKRAIFDQRASSQDALYGSPGSLGVALVAIRAPNLSSTIRALDGSLCCSY